MDKTVGFATSFVVRTIVIEEDMMIVAIKEDMMIVAIGEDMMIVAIEEDMMIAIEEDMMIAIEEDIMIVIGTLKNLVDDRRQTLAVEEIDFEGIDMKTRLVKIMSLIHLLLMR